MSQIDDMEAINDYMKRTVAVNPEATGIKSNFLQWYANLGMWDKNFSGKIYDEARTRRNQFSRSNTTTQAELDHVEMVLATGQTTEEMQGGTRPPINIKTGAVGTQVKNPTAPFLPVAGGGGEKLNRILKMGVAPGEDVRSWQKFLGIASPTTNFGQMTDQKTRDFQRMKGIKVDGAVGPDTWGMAYPNKSPETEVIVTAKEKEQIKEAEVPAKEAVKLVAQKKPVPQVKKKKVLIGKQPEHTEGDKLTADEQKKYDAPAGSIWHYAGSKASPQWLVVRPKAASSPFKPEPKKTPARTPVKTGGFADKTPKKDDGKTGGKDSPFKSDKDADDLFKDDKKKEGGKVPVVPKMAGMIDFKSPWTWITGAAIGLVAVLAGVGMKNNVMPLSKFGAEKPFRDDEEDEKEPFKLTG